MSPYDPALHGSARQPCHRPIRLAGRAALIARLASALHAAGTLVEASSAEPGADMLATGPEDPRGACCACPGQPGGEHSVRRRAGGGGHGFGRACTQQRSLHGAKRARKQQRRVPGCGKAAGALHVWWSKPTRPPSRQKTSAPRRPARCMRLSRMRGCAYLVLQLSVCSSCPTPLHRSHRHDNQHTGRRQRIGQPVRTSHSPTSRAIWQAWC